MRFLSLFALLLLLAACATAAPAPESSASRPADALTFSDATDTTLSLSERPARIACLADICVDILAELGLTPVAYLDELALHPAFFGEQAESLVRIGGSYFEPNLEDLALVEPDLVIGLPSHAGLREGLAAIAPLYIMQPKSYKDSIAYLLHVGQLTGRESEAQVAAERFTSKLEEYRARAPKDKTVLFMWGTDFGPDFGIDSRRAVVGSLLAELATYPWDDPTATEGGLIESYSLEKVLEVNPDVIFAATFAFGGDQGPIVEQLKAHPLWGELDAVKTGQVYPVSVPLWITGQGTRALGLVLDEAMRHTYPDTFAGQQP